MKSIYFIKHGHPDERSSEFDDINVPVSDEGCKVINRLGRNLVKAGEFPDLIITSRALRSVMTAELILKHYTKKIDVQIENLYLAPARDCLFYLRMMSDKYSKVMAVCHEPAATDLFNHFLSFPIMHVPSAAALSINILTPHWSDIRKAPWHVNFLMLQGKNVNLNKPHEIEQIIDLYG